MDLAERDGRRRSGGERLEAALEQLYRCALEVEGKTSLDLRAWVGRAEAWRIAQVLRECRGNRSAAARALGIGRRTLYNKMDRLGMAAAWAALHAGEPAQRARAPAVSDVDAAS